MWRYLAGAAATMLLMTAGIFIMRSAASTEPTLPQPQPVAATAQVEEGQADEPELPAANAKTKEEKRFNRVDKDKDGIIAREEYLVDRRKAFAKLDANGDGRLSFDEWAIKRIEAFAGADKDKSSTLTRVEFATTAVKRKARPRVPCPQPAQQVETE